MNNFYEEREVKYVRDNLNGLIFTNEMAVTCGNINAALILSYLLSMRADRAGVKTSKGEISEQLHMRLIEVEEGVHYLTERKYLSIADGVYTIDYDRFSVDYNKIKENK